MPYFGMSGTIMLRPGREYTTYNRIVAHAKKYASESLYQPEIDQCEDCQCQIQGKKLRNQTQHHLESWTADNNNNKIQHLYSAIFTSALRRCTLLL